MSAIEIQKLLAEKYAPPTYAYFPEVKAQVGYANRTADGIAVAMWRSHGLAVHGFEIKSWRNDWLRELKNPAKADEISGYCDHWWIVISEPRIAKIEEVPVNWGLMIVDGDKLRVSKRAPKLNPKELDREFLCELLRNLYQGKRENVLTNEGYRRGLKEGAERERQAIQGRMENIRAFEEFSGIDLGMRVWPDRAKNIGRLVKTIVDGEAEHMRAALEHLVRSGRHAIDELERALNADASKPTSKPSSETP